MLSISQDVLIIVLLLYHTVKGQLDSQEGEPDPKLIEQSQAKCEKLAIEPYFEPDLVTGKTWRVYYMWNMKLENKCIDMHFQHATPKTIRRIYYDMHEYMEQQPAWGAASLLLTMGRSKRELLLFDDQGPAGKFLGVPNTVRDGSIGPTKASIPLLKFQMKLLKDGKILVLIDCITGLATICARPSDPATLEEIQDVANKLSPSFGDGQHACIADTSGNFDLQVL